MVPPPPFSLSLSLWEETVLVLVLVASAERWQACEARVSREKKGGGALMRRLQITSHNYKYTTATRCRLGVSVSVCVWKKGLSPSMHVTKKTNSCFLTLSLHYTTLRA